MIHVRMPHGKGNAMQAAQYLLSQHDHAGKPRSVAPDVLDGDPVMVATIANQNSQGAQIRLRLFVLPRRRVAHHRTAERDHARL